MIPRVEIDTLILTVDHAVEAASAGHAEDGYAMLLAGLARAREAADAGEPWAAELLARWQQAVERYAERHDIGRA